MPDDTENLKIDEKTYVNEATLELLQRRIESNVRSSFLKTVTIPIGGGGIVAIVVAVFLWIPQQIESFLKNPNVQQTIDAKVKEQLEEAVTAYFDSNPKRFESLVGEYLSSEDAKEIIETQVNEALAPATEAVGQQVLENRDRLVQEFESQGLSEDIKRSYADIDEYTTPERVASVKANDLLVVLTKEVPVPFRYDEGVIETYLEEFEEAFGESFAFVSITHVANDGTRRLVGLVPQREFAATFNSRRRDVMDMLDFRKELPDQQFYDDLRERVADLFGSDVTKSISLNERVGNVLRNATLWNDPMNLGERRAVVDDGRLAAVTSRGRLISGLLNTDD